MTRPLPRQLTGSRSTWSNVFCLKAPGGEGWNWQRTWSGLGGGLILESLAVPLHLGVVSPGGNQSTQMEPSIREEMHSCQCMDVKGRAVLRQMHRWVLGDGAIKI